MSTDLTFFTNEEGVSLLERFTAGLNHSKYVDILVGYFRTSYTNEDEEYLRVATKAFTERIIPQNTAKKIAAAIKKEKGFNPMHILGILKRNIPNSLFRQDNSGRGTQFNAKREVILSEYLVGK